VNLIFEFVPENLCHEFSLPAYKKERDTNTPLKTAHNDSGNDDRFERRHIPTLVVRFRLSFFVYFSFWIFTLQHSTINQPVSKKEEVFGCYMM
jgi:hypothetical protein